MCPRFFEPLSKFDPNASMVIQGNLPFRVPRAGYGRLDRNVWITSSS